MDLKVGFVCDRGLNPRRPVNQDRYLALADRGLFAVFDGVGGQRAGEVASQTAADTLEEALAVSPGGSATDFIRRAIQFANRDVLELADSDPAYRTMATTIALVHIDARMATVAHVGDSRVYRLESGRLYRETIDHTDSNDLLRGSLTGSQATAGPAPEGNVINRALGVERDVDVELKSIPLREGARFLLCSDGIYRHVPDEEIAEVLARNPDPQKAADELKRIVFQRGAEDNLTAVVVQVGRAGQKAVLPAAGGVTSSSFGAERGNRIKVALDGGRSQINEGRKPGQLRRLTYTLIVLVLIAGSFYAGLRAPEFVKRAQEPPVQGPPLASSLDAGTAEFYKGHYREAAAAFALVTASEPQNHFGWYWLGRSQLEMGEYASAAQNLDRAGTEVPEANLYGAAAYRAVRNESRAKELLDRYNEQRKKQRGEEQ